MIIQFSLDWNNPHSLAWFKGWTAHLSTLPNGLSDGLDTVTPHGTNVAPSLLQSPEFFSANGVEAASPYDQPSLTQEQPQALEADIPETVGLGDGSDNATEQEGNYVWSGRVTEPHGFQLNYSLFTSKVGMNPTFDNDRYVPSDGAGTGSAPVAQPTFPLLDSPHGDFVQELVDGPPVNGSAPAADTNNGSMVIAGDTVRIDAPLVSPALTLSGHQANIEAFRNDPNFAGIDGSGFAIVVLDTGIDLDHPHFGPDLDQDGVSDRIVYQWDFADNDGSAQAASNGHGTNVTGIAASSDPTYTGAAPGADIIHLKVFSDNGTGVFSYIESALQWVVGNAATYNIASVNMSLSDFGNYSTPQQRYNIADELATLAALGIITVSASGNSFQGFNSVEGVSYPAADPNSLAVGAVFDSYNADGYDYGGKGTAYSADIDRITPFSQRDEDLTDIFAPGAPITAAGLDGGLSTMHGTSMAAPHIAGVAALAQQLAVQELGRTLSVTEFADLLTASGKTINDGDDEDDSVANTGLDFPLVDVLALGKAIQALAPPPSLSISSLEADRQEGGTGTTLFTFKVTRSDNTNKATTVDYTVSGTHSDPAPYSGNFAHQSTAKDGFHSHFFYGVTYPWAVFSGETLFTYIYLDPLNLPSQVLLQWGTQDGWNHRAYWGSNELGVGTDGSESLYHMGELPEAGKWVRLEIPADAVGLGNASLTGMAFTLYDGSATWDQFGVNDGFTDIVWFDDALPEGAIEGGLFDTWKFSGGNSADASDFGGTLPSGTVEFAPGETEKIITVEVTGDSDIEADEGFTVTLSNPTEGAEITDATATATILNDDDTPPSLSISTLNAVLPEGDDETTSFTFTVSRSGDTTDAVEVDFTVTGDGTAPSPFSGNVAYQSALEEGFHTHYFYATTYPWAVFAGETFFTHIYLDPLNMPSQVMLQWGAQDGWDHRAYWGENLMDLGTDGTESRYYMGALPEAGKWVRLEVPVDAVGLGNAGLTGMAFTLFDGRAAWDYVGVNDGFWDIAWVDDALPHGAIAGGIFEAWDPTIGTSADASDFGGAFPSGTINFAPGETEKTITVEIAGDSAVEADEDFIITLSNPTEGAKIINATATITIENDDIDDSGVAMTAVVTETGGILVDLVDEALFNYSAQEDSNEPSDAAGEPYANALVEDNDGVDNTPLPTQPGEQNGADLLGVSTNPLDAETSFI